MNERPKRGLGTRILLIVGSTFALLWGICILTLILGGFVWMREARDGNPLFGLMTATTATRATTTTNVASPIPILRVTAAPPAPLVVIATPEGGDYETAVLKNIYAQVNDSVVFITALAVGSELDPRGEYNFNEDDLLPASSGSGFVWDEYGHLVTNHHVVDGVSQLQVTFSDGSVALATVIGIDVSSDLAVLQIDPEGYPLQPVRRGQMAEVAVGMRVVAIGNPFGLAGTMTSGIVSAMNRSIPARNSFNIPASIQTDAAINPGNSGGPLLNERGEVIGVNAQIRSEVRANSGVGFAIPIAIVERVVPALITDGVYQHSYMGVRGETLSPLCAADLKLDKALRGAYISEVLRGTPAAKAGLRGGSQPSQTKYVGICPATNNGDVILAINDEPVSSFDDILRYLEYYTSPGDVVTLRVLRAGAERPMAMTLAARPERVNN
ncbi:MAG: trypsin-like peptidase domain-containing protein [Caldilineaceae bacterium]|nr:trypsin-like peptidase domain-containing protein [Caldilineaceae bacterium]